MSTDRDVTRIVRSWLEEGVTALPDRVLDNVLDRLPATHQRRSWWPARRLHEMNAPLRIATAAAAVVVLALVGINLVPRTGGVGGPAATPTVAPTPSAPPTASPAPTPTGNQALPSSGLLAPGTYRSDFLTFTVPSGWSAYQSWGVSKTGSGPPDGLFFAPWEIRAVWPDPCHLQTKPSVTVGPTVDDLVNALVAQKRGAVVKPVDITIDGHRGKLIDLMVPLNVDVAACEGGEYRSWTDVGGGDRYNQGPGQHDLIAILDVNGRRLAIDRVYWPSNSAADRAELQAIVDSIKITP